MLRRVALGRTDVLEERSASIITVTKIDELETTLALTSKRRMLRRNTCYLHDSGNSFLRNVCSYNSHTT
jgi:hypothetical protein